MYILLIFFLLCGLSYAGTNDLIKLDKELKGITYENKMYATTNKINEKQIEKMAQSVETTIRRKTSNCVDAAFATKKIAEQNGLKATYLIERKHIAVRVETKDGAAYRYSNGKNKGRCW